MFEAEFLRLKAHYVTPGEIKRVLTSNEISNHVTEKMTLFDLLKRKNVSYSMLSGFEKAGPFIKHAKVIEQIEILSKYFDYIARQEREVQKNLSVNNTIIPKDFDYKMVTGLSTEIYQKLSDHKPMTLGEASRLSGVTPVAVSLLRVFLKKMQIF